MTNKQIAIYLKRKLNKSLKEFGDDFVGNTYNINSYPFTETNNFLQLKEECRKLNFYLDYICDSPLYRFDIHKKRNQVITYLSRINP